MASLLQWLATALSAIGAVINIRRNRWGFPVWIVAAFCWIGFGLLQRPTAWGLILTQMMFIGLNIWGFIGWGKCKEDKMTETEMWRKAFGAVVGMLEVSEGTDWEVIHHRVAERLGIDPSVLEAGPPDGKEWSSLLVHNCASNWSPAQSEDHNLKEERIFIRRWIGYDENGHGMFEDQLLWQGEGFDEEQWRKKMER